MIRGLAGAIDDVLRFVVAIPAGLLPRRHWPALEDRFPVARAAFVSALATFLLAFVIGVPAFFRYTESNTSLAIRKMLEETGWRTPPPEEQRPAPGTGTTLWGTSFLSPFSFVFLTPVGWITLYLGVTGYLRMVSVYVDDARGDPVLTMADAALLRRRSHRQAAHATRTREAREGVEVPDRLVTGRSAGLDNAEFVVVASRRKQGWRKGVLVITADKWYRLGEPVERETPNGLRTLYPLNEHKDLEVLRDGVPYELPPLGTRR